MVRMLEESHDTDGSQDLDNNSAQDYYENVEYLETELIHSTYADIYSNRQLKKSLQCPLCGKTFKKASTLRDHQNIHNNLKPHICPICSRPFSFETSLVSHIKLHENVKNHMCSFCSKAFARRRYMLHHEKTVHLKQKPFVCPLCDKPYNNQSCWRKHIAMHENPKELNPPMPIRVKPKRPKDVKSKALTSVVNPEAKKSRQRRNTGPKRHKCDLCDKMFARRRNVLHHMTYTHNKI